MNTKAKLDAARRRQEDSDSESASFGDPEPYQETDKAFNWYRYACTDRGRKLVAEETTRLLSYERCVEPRTRARRAVDLQRFEFQVEALLSELALHHLNEPGKCLCLPLGHTVLDKASRYKPSFMTGTLSKVVHLMASPDIGLCLLMKGERAIRHGENARPGWRSMISAGSWLVERMGALKVTASDFALRQGEETIILRDSKEWWENRGKELEYDDTPETMRMRDELDRINVHLAEADLKIDRAQAKGERRLKRIFTGGTFEQHGRMYGGFWIGMKSEARRAIKIDGRQAVDLDFGQINPRLLYAEARVEPHFEDAYAIPGFQAHRDGIKQAFNALLCADSPLKRFPKGIEELFPEGARWATVVDAIRRQHPAIEDRFFTGYGLILNRRESGIMVRVVLALIGQGITALPIHDGMLVAGPHADTARQVMGDEYRAETGFEGLVTVKSFRRGAT